MRLVLHWDMSPECGLDMQTTGPTPLQFVLRGPRRRRRVVERFRRTHRESGPSHVSLPRGLEHLDGEVCLVATSGDRRLHRGDRSGPVVSTPSPLPEQI